MRTNLVIIYHGLTNVYSYYEATTNGRLMTAHSLYENADFFNSFHISDTDCSIFSHTMSEEPI